MSTSKSNSARETAIQEFLKNSRIQLSEKEMVEGISKGDKQILAQSITLLESTHPDHLKLASNIVHQCLPKSGNSIRIGITGVPGVGKSTFIEAFGTLLTKQGIKTAVLAVDPSSNINKGSILGDKTRMDSLSVDPLAFVRPSPSSGALGGVANATRESILLCEAAGFEVIIVETVGVGQSEYLVRDMVDFFLLLMLPGAGDEIQGIKRGIMEMADGLYVNKADGTNQLAARKAAQSYENAMHLFPARDDQWITKTGTCSAIDNKNIDTIWDTIQEYKSQLISSQWFQKKRKKQLESWLFDQVESSLKSSFYSDPLVKSNIQNIKDNVINGLKTPYSGAEELLELFNSKK